MMKDMIINISKETSMVSCFKKIIGNDGENLQGNIIFKFEDEFVDGIARLEYKIKNDKKYIMLNKVDETYTIPIKSILTVEGQIDMQLVITEEENDEGIPIFKSNTFYVYCNKSINAEIEEPEDYSNWIEVANQKLVIVQNAIDKVDDLETHIDELSEDVEQLNEEVVNVNNDIEQLTNNMNEIADDVNKIDSNIKNAFNKINTINDNIGTINNNAINLSNNVNDISNKVDTNTKNIKNNNEKITKINSDLVDKENKINNLNYKKADKTSIPDVSEFIKRSVSNLLYYYKIDETYTRQEINQLIGAIKTISMKVEQYKPAVGEKNVIYLIKNEKSESGNIYDEYIYVNDKWELIGTTKVDLSNYITKEILNNTLKNYTTTSTITETLKNYVLSSSLTETLKSYVNSTNLAETLKSYVTSNSLSETLKNYAKLTDVKGVVVEIGQGQYSYEGTILPTIPVEIARTVYTNDKAGILQVLHWTLYGTENNLKVVSSDHIATKYSIDVLIHNKFHCAYEWTDETTGNINPLVQSQQEVPVFTNNALGTIKGSIENGKVSANSDGTGTVNGFKNLSEKVTTIENNYLKKDEIPEPKIEKQKVSSSQTLQSFVYNQNVLKNKTWNVNIPGANFIWHSKNNTYFRDSSGNHYKLVNGNFEKITMNVDVAQSSVWHWKDKTFMSTGGSDRQYLFNEDTEQWEKITFSGPTAMLEGYHIHVCEEQDIVICDWYFSSTNKGCYIIHPDTLTVENTTVHSNGVYLPYSRSDVNYNGELIGYDDNNNKNYKYNKSTNNWEEYKFGDGLDYINSYYVFDDGKNYYYVLNSDKIYILINNKWELYKFKNLTDKNYMYYYTNALQNSWKDSEGNVYFNYHSGGSYDASLCLSPMELTPASVGLAKVALSNSYKDLDNKPYMIKPVQVDYIFRTSNSKIIIPISMTLNPEYDSNKIISGYEWDVKDEYDDYEDDSIYDLGSLVDELGISENTPIMCSGYCEMGGTKHIAMHVIGHDYGDDEEFTGSEDRNDYFKFMIECTDGYKFSIYCDFTNVETEWKFITRTY